MSKSPMLTLRDLAMKLPDTSEGIACPGTAMERRTVKVGTKAFVFLGELAEAKKMAAAEPERFRAGAGGWVKVMFDAKRPPPLAVMKRWIAESHRLAVMTKPKKSARR